MFTFTATATAAALVAAAAPAAIGLIDQRDGVWVDGRRWLAGCGG